MKLKNRSAFVGFTTAALLAVVAWPVKAQIKQDIAVTNFKDGEVIRYSTPLIAGTLADDKAESVTLINNSSKRPSREMKGLALKGRFKVLADLVPGENRLTIKSGMKTSTIKLTFKPQTTPYKVRAIYFTNNTGDTKYLSPVPNDKQDVIGKLSTAMLLLQSFTADRMQHMGYGRKTFNVELDENGHAKVFIVKGDQPPSPNFNGGAVDQAIQQQAASPFTNYLVVLGRDCGYTAVGPLGKAFMGGSCIYTWPNNIQEAQAAFMDATPIDTDKFHVDAVGRDVFWANTSTTIGACLHEIGHSFGLPHSMDGFCIMTRGIDYFNRFFTLIEPPSKQNSKSYEFKDDEMARFCKVTANNLATSRHFAMDDRKFSDTSKVSFSYDPIKKEITVRSDIGLGFVGLEVLYANPGADYVIPIDPNKPAPKEIKIPAKEWERFGGGPFQVRAIDLDDRGDTDRDPLRKR